MACSEPVRYLSGIYKEMADLHPPHTKFGAADVLCLRRACLYRAVSVRDSFYDRGRLCVLTF